MNPEIAPAAERIAYAPQETCQPIGRANIDTPAAADEPRLTLSQLQGLLRDAAAYERAQRPIVLHEAAQTVPAAQAPPTHVYIPMPPTSAFTPAAVERPRNIWPLLFTVAGGIGLGSGTAAVATGNLAAVLVACAAIAAWSTATYRLVFCREA